MVGIITKSANWHKLWRRKCHRCVTVVTSDDGLFGSPTEPDYNIRSGCSLELSGKQRSPLAFRLARLLASWFKWGQLPYVLKRKSAHIYLECLWSWSSLKTLHRWAKPGFSRTYLHLLLQHILNTHMKKTGLHRKSEGEYFRTTVW